MIQGGNWNKVKRLYVPIALGVFVIGVIAFCIVYIQEKRHQSSLATQIGQLSDMVSQTVETDEELLTRFSQIEQQIPVISGDPVDGPVEQLQLIEQVNTLIIDRVSDSLLYPEIDISAAGNFKITHISVETEKVGGTNYTVLAFNVNLSGLTYEQLRFFVNDVSSMESLPTLVVTRLEISPENAQSSFDLDFDIYCRTG